MGTNNDSGNGQEESDPDDESAESRARGIGIRFALQPVTDLLKGVVNVGISHPSEAPRPELGEPRPRERSAVDRRRSDDTPASTNRTAAGYLVETYRYEDELVVVADLPGVRDDELSVGLAERSNAVLISVREEVVSRVSLPWDAVEVDDVWFYNEVLNVRVRPVGGDAGEE